MDYGKIIGNLTSALNERISAFIREKALKPVSIILGWNYSGDGICVWFDDSWEDFGYYEADDSAFVQEAVYFSHALEGIPYGAKFVMENTPHEYPVFGNRIVFRNELFSSEYNLVRNASLEALVDICRKLCSSMILEISDHLVSFKVMGISDSEHPELICFYGISGSDPLLFLEVKNEKADLNCYCMSGEEGLIFFMHGDEIEREWEKVFKTDSSVYEIPYERMRYFSTEKNLTPGEIVIVLDSDVFRLNRARSNKKHILHDAGSVTAHITKKLQEKRPAAHREVPPMPPPYEKEEFQNWCRFLHESRGDFGWKDLEFAVKKYGTDFIYSFVPEFYKESRYYDITLKQAAEILAREGDFEYAGKCFEQISESMQRNEWGLYLDILLGVRDYETASQFISEKMRENSAGWQRAELYYRQIFLKASTGNVHEALSDLENIESDERSRYHDWFLAHGMAHIDQNRAMEILIPLLTSGHPVIPGEIHFSEFDKIHEVFRDRKKILHRAREYDKLIEERHTPVKPHAEISDSISLMKMNIQSDSPRRWVLGSEFSTGGENVRNIFAYKSDVYFVTGKGCLYQLSESEGELISVLVMDFRIKVRSVSLWENMVFLAGEGAPVTVYDMSQKTICAEIDRLFPGAPDYIYGNEEFIIVSTVAGAEVYDKFSGEYKLKGMIGVGSSVIDYAWPRGIIMVDDFLYVASGNAGLAVYKLKNGEEPEFVSVLACDVPRPFCTDVVQSGDLLIINVEGLQWILDISDRENPVSLKILKSSENGMMTGPGFDGKNLYFLEKDRPMMWGYTCDGKDVFDARCIQIVNKDGEESFIYYAESILFCGGRLFVAAKDSIYLLSQYAAEKLDCGVITKLNDKFSEIYRGLIKNLNEQSLVLNMQNVGFVKVEKIYDKLAVSLYSECSFAEFSGYSAEQLFVCHDILSLAGIELVFSQNFPYGYFLEKEFEKVSELLGRRIIEKLSGEKLKWYAETVWFISSGYNESADRELMTVEKVISRKK